MQLEMAFGAQVNYSRLPPGFTPPANVRAAVEGVILRARRVLELVCARLALWRLGQQRLLVFAGYPYELGGEPATQQKQHEQQLVSIESQYSL